MQKQRNALARDAYVRTGQLASLAWSLVRASRTYVARVAIAGLWPKRRLAGGRA